MLGFAAAVAVAAAELELETGSESAVMMELAGGYEIGDGGIVTDEVVAGGVGEEMRIAGDASVACIVGFRPVGRAAMVAVAEVAGPTFAGVARDNHKQGFEPSQWTIKRD